MRKLKIVAGLSVAAALTLSACSSGTSAEDVCQAMKDGQKSTNNYEELTEAEYTELRAKFAEVDDAELSASGVKLLDAVWQVEQLGEGEELGAMAFLGPITEGMSGVVGACTKHGVVLDLMDK